MLQKRDPAKVLLSLAMLHHMYFYIITRCLHQLIRWYQLKHARDYLFYLMKGLEQLPAVKTTVYATRHSRVMNHQFVTALCSVTLFTVTVAFLQSIWRWFSRIIFRAATCIGARSLGADLLCSFVGCELGHRAALTPLSSTTTSLVQAKTFAQAPVFQQV